MKSKSEVLSWLPHFQTSYIGKWPHKYEAIYLNKTYNQELKSRLELDGFFIFHETNNGQIITVHQVIAFYSCGGIHAAKRGMRARCGEVEVHHIDGNTLNNEPSNLSYVPVELHNLITKHQRSVHKYLKLFKRRTLCYKLSELPIFDRRGRLIKNNLSWATRLIIKSVVNTYRYCLKKAIINPNISLAPASSIRKWCKLITKRLKAGIDTSYVKSIWLNLNE